MRGHIVRQLWWGDLLYISYDEGTYCTSVMMRGPFVRQLCVGRNRETNKIYWRQISLFFHTWAFFPPSRCRCATSPKHCRYTTSAKHCRYTNSPKHCRYTTSAKHCRYTTSAKHCRYTNSPKHCRYTTSAKHCRYTTSAKHCRYTTSAKHCRYNTSAKHSRHTWSLFGANIGWNHLGSLRYNLFWSSTLKRGSLSRSCEEKKKVGEKCKHHKNITSVDDSCHNEWLALSSAVWFVESSLLVNCYHVKKEAMADHLPKYLL